ncbi:MAG TPA: phage shock protein A [Lachnospiraceae bacterium]|nr:PspA/IM30 family protein [Eubacterium sp.]HBZ03730.1 phage shock protein A [Lachnospiraceae bacterium]
MGILSRFKDIMSSNINALLDKAEDPEKMIDQTLRNLNNDLAKVKEETAEVMADEAKAKRNLDECNAEIARMQQYAEKAVVAGNDADATRFLTEKSKLVAKQATLQQVYDVSAANAMKMRQMHDKLVNDIAELDSRKDAIKAKIRLAKAQQDINKMTSKVNSESSFASFQRMEDKADAMLDVAAAEAELNATTASSEVDNLTSKYDASPDAAVQDELAALKAKMGMTSAE